MKKIHVNKTKIIVALCIAIPATVAAVLVPKAIKHAKRSKYARV